MKFSESRNRYSLIKYENDFKTEPNNHINYDEQRVDVKKYNADKERGDGWVEHKITKTKITLRRYNPDPTAYEKRVWQLFFKTGFSYINKSGKHLLFYGQDEDKKLSFSVFGQDKDRYTFIMLDCFTLENRIHLDDKLETMQKEFAHVVSHLKMLYEDEELVFKYIIVIKGFKPTIEQEEIIRNNNYTILTEVDVEYFEELYKNLEDAAYYQFCGKLFEGMTMPKINTKIPAIRGRMGGHTYYVFSIDPHILLRLSFVLHKTKAHEEAMPTYQRLVKRSRIIKITDFLKNKNGYFPNSIVINFGEKCVFDEVHSTDDIFDTEIGYLKIPQKYRVAYIIDGQHRLMGYAAFNNVNQQIPVVAFEELSKPTQVKLFMEMNENQKSVPKELRNTLNKDLLSASNVLEERMQGLRLQIAYSFVDHEESPLRGYVSDGVDKKEFTLEGLQQPLYKSRKILFGDIRGNDLVEPGLFFRKMPDDPDNINLVVSSLRNFLFKCVDTFIRGLEDKESLDNIKGNNSFIQNRGINGFILFIADILNYKRADILNTIKDNALTLDPSIVFCIIQPYIETVLEYIKKLEPKECKGLRETYGERGPVRYQRTFQKGLHLIYEDFNPSGLEDWIASNSNEVVEDALRIISQLKQVIRNEFTNRFRDKVGVSDWVEDSLPDDINRSCYDRMMKYKKDSTSEQLQEKSLWDFVEDKDLFAIACKKENDTLIKNDFTEPGMSRGSGSKKRYEWIKQILKIEDVCNKNHSCESKDIEKLYMLFKHFTDKGLVPDAEQEQI